MPNVKSQITSPELSKLLRKAGLPQTSLFYWDGQLVVSYDLACRHEDMWDRFTSAFTAGELMDILPAHIQVPGKEPFDYFRLNITKLTAKNIQYIANYCCDSSEIGDQLAFPKLLPKNVYDESFVECLGKTLIMVMDMVLNVKEQKQ